MNEIKIIEADSTEKLEAMYKVLANKDGTRVRFPRPDVYVVGDKVVYYVAMQVETDE